MSYLQHIAQRNTGHNASLLQPLAPFIETGAADVFSEDALMPPPSTHITNVHPVQHTTVVNEAQKTRSVENKETAYIRSQVERTLVLPREKETQQPITIPGKTVIETNTIQWLPSPPPLVSPVIVEKELVPVETVKKEIVPVAIAQQPLPVVKQLVPVEAPEIVPQKMVAQNKLVIGKITVEVIPPVQPAVKTRERTITKVVTTTAGNSSQAGRNKLSFGLGQL